MASIGFGTVHPHVLVLVCLAGTALAAWTLLSTSEHTRTATRTRLLGLAALCLSSLTLIPMPGGLREWLQPGLAPVLDQVLALTDQGAHPLAVHPRAALLAWAAGGAVLLTLLVAQRLLSTSDRRARMARWLSWIGVLVVLLATLHYVTDAHSIYWATEVGADTDKPSLAPFVSANHGAALLAALLPLSIGAHWYRRDLFSLIFGTGVILLGVVFSTSRGGVAAAVVGLVVLGALAVPRRWSGLVLAVPLLISTVVYLAGVEAGTLLWSESLEELSTGRTSIWRDALTLITGAPLLGVGPGGFADAHGVVKSSVEFASVAHAHQDLLELAVECGLLGGALVLALIGVVLGSSLRTLFRHEPGRRRTLVAAYLGSMASLLTSAMLDFPMHSGAIALLAAVVAGGGGAQPHRRSKKKRRTANKGLGIVAMVLAATILYVVLAPTRTPWGNSERTLAQALEETRVDPEQARQTLRQALGQRPLRRQSLLALGALHTRLGEADEALLAYELAVQVRPRSLWTWRALARERLAHGDEQGALEAWRGMLVLDFPTNDQALPYIEEAMAVGPDPLTSLLIALPDRGQRHCQAAVILREQSRIRDAELLLATNTDRYPCARIHLAALYLHEKRYHEALELVTPHQDRCEFLRLSARAHEHLGHYPEALAMWERSRRACGNDRTSRRDLARTILRSRGDAHRATRILQSLVEEDPSDDYSRRLLIEALVQSGRLEEAEDLRASPPLAEERR